MPERTYPEGVTSWVDVEVADLDAAQAFYSGLLGWSFAQVADDYAIAQLDGQDVAGIARGGGAAWNTYVAADDADTVADRVRQHGGRVVAGPADASGGAGRWAACTDPAGVAFRLWQAGARRGAQLVNAPGTWNFSDLRAADPAQAAEFYAQVFGWEISDVGFALMIRRPGYGDHLAATIDPGIHERQAGVSAPPGFADAIGWLVPTGPDDEPHWHVSFTVAERDTTAAEAERLGGSVLRRTDTDWTREALVRDPQGATFTASQFTPPN
jgi:predicted enzyme related to lactoylglutathione lyase